MVFEKALSSVLNSVLGDFVENLDGNQLNVGIWGGDVQLKNLVLKPTALDDLDLPVQTVYGSIGNLVLKIPWKSLYTSPTVIIVEDIYLLSQPNQQVKYDPVKEAKRNFEAKKKEIQKVEDAKKAEAEKGKPKADAGFVEKLVASIIKNIQLTIKRIHIRYEDRVTNAKSPFSLGVTLSELVVESTDSNWQKGIIDDISKIYKIVQLEGLSLYWNCNSKCYGDISHVDMVHKLRNEIASKQNKPNNYNYLLGPINSSARLRMNQKPENDSPSFTIPKIHLNLDMEKLFIGISKVQYRDIIALADSMDRMSKGIPYRKYRPDLNTYKGHYKQWWHFAYIGILEENVKRKKREWDWNHILKYRNTCKEYKELYSKEATKKSLKPDEKQRLEECERLLDLTNIVIIRQRIELETERLAKAQDKAEKKSWIGWMWGGSSQSDVDQLKKGTAILKQFENEMTPEEKNRLYKAIDYQENAAPAIYPDAYIDNSCSFLLRTLQIQLIDEESEERVILNSHLKGVRCKLETRPAASAIKVHIKIDDFTIIGMQQGDFLPEITTSLTQDKKKGLLEVLFETNPLDGHCDQKIEVIAQPVKVIYDAQTINKIVDIFRIPPDTTLDQIQAAAGSRLTDVKEMTSTGLQYAIEKHVRVDLNIDMHAPFVIIPFGGKYTGIENVLVANLGRFKMYSFGKRSSSADVRKLYEGGKEQSEIYQFMREHSYDNFRLELNDLQLVMAQSDENWNAAIKESITSTMHLLNPVTLSVTYSKCVIVDDPRLPLSKVTAELPSIDFQISEARLMLLMALFYSIELPSENIPEKESLSKLNKGSSTMLLKYKELQDSAKQTKVLLNNLSKNEDKKEFIQFTTMEAQFVMSELSITINRQETVASQISQLACLKINTLDCRLKQQTYTTNVSLHLGSISVKQNREGQVIDIISTPLTNTDKYLFKVEFIQVDIKSPELHSTHQSCETRLLLNFGVLNVILHQEGLLSLMQFSTNIQDTIANLQTVNMKDRIATTSSKRLHVIEENSEMAFKALNKTSKKKRITVVVETIKFKLCAALQEVSVKLATDISNISLCAIRGIDTTVIVKETYTQVNAKLQEIVIKDLNPNSYHTLILSGTEGIALTSQIVLNNLEEESEHPDIDVTVKMGGMRIVFLNWFVSNVLDFLNKFQTAQDTIIEASQAAANSAKAITKDVYDKATKISLNIHVKAPVILVPVNSKSYDALFLDLGVITLSNKFITLDIKNEKGNSAVVDNLKLTLHDLKIIRVKLEENDPGVMKECLILEPVTFNLVIKRNLSVGWYSAIPDIEVSGNIEIIELKLSQADYIMIMSTLSGNLAEGQSQASATPLPTAAAPIVRKSQTSDVQHLSDGDVCLLHYSDQKQPTIFLKFAFAMERLVVNLYTGGNKELTVSSSSHNSDTHLARFEMEGLAVKGRILSDQSLVTSVLLVNCLLDDMRKGKGGKLRRLIERSRDDEPSSVCGSAESVGPIRSMIDVTYQQKGSDMFADVRVYSFTLILSVDYLLKVADFFNDPNAQTNISVPSAKSTTSLSKNQKSKVVVASQSNTPTESQITINLKVEKPDIILVEHMDNIDTNAMILNGEILVKIRMAGEHQVINGTIKDLQVYTCSYNQLYRANTRSSVLHPVTISLAGSTPQDKGLHVELLITNVHLSVSPATIELINRILVTMSSSENNEDAETEEVFSYDNLWTPRSVSDQDYWFLKTDVGADALEMMHYSESKLIKKVLQELCIISIPSITLTVEAGVGNKTLPMLMLETGIKGSARNWSSQLSIEASMVMQMGYYNSRLALWEPLIEPVETINESTNRQVSVPWELKLDLSMNQEQDDTLNTLSPASETEELQLPQPVMNIDIISESNLEITVTKTFLEVLQNLSKAFAEAVNTEKIMTFSRMAAPYEVLNEIGEDVTLMLESSSFQLADGGIQKDINNSEAVPLQLKPDSMETETLKLGTKLVSGSHNDYILHVKVINKNCELFLPVMRADKRFFTMNYRSNGSDNWGIISDIKVDEGVTIITIRSILQIHNHFSIPIDVYYMTAKGNELELVGVVQPHTILNVPLKAVYNPTNELFFSIMDYAVSDMPYIWKDLQTKLTVTKLLHCAQKKVEKGYEPFVIKAIGEMEQVYYENTSRHTMASSCYNIHLRPAVVFKNCLPLDLICCVDEVAEEFCVKAGDTLELPNVDPGKNILVVRIPDYLEKEWSCRSEILEQTNEFTVWTFYSYDSPTKMCLDLGLHTLDKNGSLIISLYCPFWMLNKTGLMIGYKSSDENMNVLHHPAHFKGPILFSFNAKQFFCKKKTCIRVESGEWSDKFSLDVAGSSGVVSCKTDNVKYQIGVHNQLTFNSLTKQVTFIPYYVVINNAPFSIECQESERSGDSWVTVEPKSCSAFWPKIEAEDKLMRIKVKGTNQISAPFLYTESHNTLLRLNNKYGGINVDIQLTEGAVYINVAAYESGFAPALLVNHTDTSILFWEKESFNKRTLEPKHSILYTWENPSGPRQLVWDRSHKKEIVNDLRKDGGGEFCNNDDINICWASFLDGMQRVLLFTRDRNIVQGAQLINLFEVIQQEITVSIHGVGVSLVNNTNRQEVMYAGIASSGIIWEVCKMNGRRYKQLGMVESTHIENSYQHFLLRQNETEFETGRMMVDNKIEVDFKTGMMIKPHKRKLKRTFQTGLWFQMKTSPSQMQLHMKVNRLQIDNQLFDCIFPVVLAPVPLPKSVTADSGFKPFMEVSIVQLLLRNSQIRQFKYFKVLVQEFHIKVDLGFVNAVLEILAQSERSEEEEKELFLKDTNLVTEVLYSHASSQSIQEQKSFYDLLHFSPFKIHISFSMAAGSSGGQNTSAPNVLNILLQGVGVTLTDIQDVVFKLAFFERNYTFLTQGQLVNEAISHYVGQAVKQLYVLVLGLDVIGNPYGLVLGITKGVEDLFYEPFQGAIQGPGEFAEGLALGVKSLFGHTVGGAAGAMSRITGAMGKGIAALTFDDEFQRKRRDQLNKKPATVQEGIARGGKGLVMGVYSGVTGVFTKPVTGAKEQGVEGFFKGLGKGAVGLVTRPVAGVVDFASGSLDAVKRAAESSEDTLRLRPPRFLQADGFVTPYNRHKSEGQKLLMELSKGKYGKTDVYETHYIVIAKKEMILLTNKRIAYIVHNDIFGGWQIEWSYTWDELSQPAKVVPKGVLISVLKEKKKLFGSNDSMKIIMISDSALKEEICIKIESLRSG